MLMYHSLFIQSSIKEHFGCFQFVCVCVCVRERERQYELSCYKILVHDFVWALTIKSFAELSRSIIVRSCDMTRFKSIRGCFQIAFPLTMNENSRCSSSLPVNGLSDFCI